MELRRKREESMDTVLVPLRLLSLVIRGFFGVCRNRATESMLCVVQESERGSLSLPFVTSLWFLVVVSRSLI